MLTVTPVGGGGPIAIKDVSTSVKKGRWGLLASSGGELVFQPVASASAAMNAYEKFVIIDKEIVHRDKGDSDYETIVPSSNTDWDGIFPKVWRPASHLIVHDSSLGSNSSGDFANASPGDPLYLSVNGFPTTLNAADQAETLGNELIQNGGFETAGGGAPDYWASWTESAGDGTLADEGTIVHSGNHAMKAVAGASANTYVVQAISVTAGNEYKISFWTRGDGNEAGRYKVRDATNGADIVALTSTGVSGTDYTQVDVYVTAPTGCTSIELYLYCPAAQGGTAYFDDVSFKQLTARGTMIGFFRSYHNGIVIYETL